MWIEAVEITNFRNIARALIRPSESVNIFYGDNGAGKTNLLEAVFTLCLGRSQRGARDVMMVGEKPVDGETRDYFRLDGIGRISGREVRLECAYQKGGRKKFTIDSNPARISKLYRYFSLVSMAPDDVTIFSGAPSMRRRFTDLYLSQASPEYLADLTDYNKALAQKNSFLKDGRDEECPFDPILIKVGTKIMKARDRFIHFLKGLAPGYYRQIAGDDYNPEAGPVYDFHYDPSVAFEDKDEIEDNFRNKLDRYRKRENILETAVVGPHRDDIDFRIGEFPARGYGSQGELRTAAVATMMAAANFLESRREEKPILLLDEIFAELDNTRRENLAVLFDKFDQIFLTTAIRPPEVLAVRGKVFTIKDGEVL